MKKAALEDFLNQTVQQLDDTLFSWKGIVYEVLTPSIVKKRHNWSGFVKHKYKQYTYYIREASNEVIQKWHKNL